MNIAWARLHVSGLPPAASRVMPWSNGSGRCRPRRPRPIRRTVGARWTGKRPSGSDVRLVSEAARRYGDFLGLDLAVAGA